jgi:flagellar biosynthesis/type III secretory pathway protein FliH
MTHWVLCRAGGLEIGVEGDPVIDAGSLPLVGEATAVLRRLETLREAVVRSGEARREQALREGLAEAHAIAGVEASDAIARAAAGFDRALREECERRRAREVDLALAVVTRIAGGLGEAPIVAALARTAIAELDAVQPVRVRVPPSLEPAVRAALAKAADGAAGPAVEVVGDERLDRFDCEIDHGDAIVDASLGTQLQAIREALGDGPEAAP